MKYSKIKLQMVQEKSFDYNSKKIKSTDDIVRIINDYEELGKLTEESTILICLNNKNQIIAYEEIAKGGINFCNFDVKTIFKTLLLCNGCRFILIHNHPSGFATPSKCDLEITNRLINASELMGIVFLDHVIIAGNNFTSCLYEKQEK